MSEPKISRKFKRLIHKRERREVNEDLRREFLSEKSSFANVPVTPVAKNDYCFLGYTQTPIQSTGERVYDSGDFIGEYFEPDSEVVEAAFSHPQGLTKKCLSDSGIFTSLSDLEKSEINPDDPDSLTEFLNEDILFQLRYSP